MSANAQLGIYQNAKSALMQYETIDEVKTFRNKAVAVEAYARMANDFELERAAARARIRAERRCGEILQETPKARGAVAPNTKRGKEPTRSQNGATSPTLAEMGLTKKQSADYQALARVDEEEFEAALVVQGHKPSTTHIARKQKAKESPPKPKAPRMPSDALWLWGRLVDMERDDLFTRRYEAILADMTPAMLADVKRIAPQLKRWMK